VIDGPINGDLFTAYVEKVLVPTLAKGDIVILDNLGSHKGRRARMAIRAAHAHLIFLPLYSPDLNPIEHCSPSSNTSCAPHSQEPSRRHCERPAISSTCSAQSNVQTTSKTQDMLLSKNSVL